MMEELLGELKRLADENGGGRVVAVDIVVGALAGISPDHLREHFLESSPGSVAEGAVFRARMSGDPLSTGLLIESMELER